MAVDKSRQALAATRGELVSAVGEFGLFPLNEALRQAFAPPRNYRTQHRVFRKEFCQIFVGAHSCCDVCGLDAGLMFFVGCICARLQNLSCDAFKDT